MRKKTLKLIFALLTLVAIERFTYTQTGGFRIAKITSELPHNPDWEVAVIDPPQELISQEYTFLGKGVQCYAFESEDKKTVLKVFKHYHAWPSNDTLKKMPLPSFLEGYRAKSLAARYKRINSIFSSCKIAMEELKEETGMLYLHLNKTAHIGKKLTLVDKIGIKYEIDLDTTPFLLQKKGVLLFDKLTELIKSGETERTQEAIRSMLTLIATRCQKGISNTDPILNRNVGFFGMQAIEIDTGSFAKNPYFTKPYQWKKEMLNESAELQEWLEKHCPELIPFFHAEVHALISI